MTSKARATGIPRLVRQLGSRRQDVIDRARARLALIGPRAVAALTAALESHDAKIRANSVELLSLILDPSSRLPLQASMLDQDAKVREVAAMALARFPHYEATRSLEGRLGKEREPAVRRAIVHSLIEHYASGQDRALRRLLDLLFDPAEEIDLRVAAIQSLPRHLPANERRGILRRLRHDPVERVAEAARQAHDLPSTTSDPTAAEVREWLNQLGLPDYSEWKEAFHRLSAAGASVVDALVAEMRRRADDPDYGARVGLVLKSLGPRRGRCMAALLDKIDEPLPLQVLIEAIGVHGQNPASYRLHDLIERIRPRIGQGRIFDPWQRVRAKAHLELARIGSRVAIDDLRDALTDERRRLEFEVVQALGRIGTRREIPDLLEAYDREERFVQLKIADAIRAIVRRERIRRDDPWFKDLPAEHRRHLRAIYPKQGGRGKARRKSSRRGRR